jgi:hypothetical protein
MRLTRFLGVSCSLLLVTRRRNILIALLRKLRKRGNEKSGAYKHLAPPPLADQGPRQIPLLSHVRNGQDEKVQVIGYERPAREGDDYEVNGVAMAIFGDSPLPV